ncbi:unnamed protein product [Eruca vesicaria subsp. sativa]|uniref:Uncharacterized protein n=1 Tax=Eruca vesicaria subsp. sativa TaxID=29727 RepID=A0ABC8KJY2_ERUVS|nr:unnamed protein product [Eruca vesicaria subsp. sativa]
MANLQSLVSELKAGRYYDKASVFWEAHNVNKGGDLMAVFIALVDEKLQHVNSRQDKQEYM